jgi:hypothetical protein
MVMVS